MDINCFDNGMSRFLSLTEKMLHEITMVLYQKRKAYPIDKPLLERNAFYSMTLFCVYRGKEPSLGEAASSCDGDYEETFSRALSLYEKWSSLGLSLAIYSYCDIMNDLLSASALSKCQSDYCILPNLRSKKEEILSFLNESFREETPKESN